MPTTLTWDFEGGKNGSTIAARRGKQRIYFGDTVYDEVLGEGIGLRVEGGDVGLCMRARVGRVRRTRLAVLALQACSMSADAGI